MSGPTTFLSAVALWLPLLFAAAASADDERKLIDKKPADREPTTEKEFLVRAIAREVAEVKFAEGAVKKAQSEDVRKLARTMVDEHTKIRDDLMEHAKKHKVAVVEGLEKTHREEYARLGAREGAEFDREYLRWVIDGHESGVKLYKKWGKGADDADVRATADRALRLLNEHLGHARKLAPPAKD